MLGHLVGPSYEGLLLLLICEAVPIQINDPGNLFLDGKDVRYPFRRVGLLNLFINVPAVLNPLHNILYETSALSPSA